jgi:hypothetical protein
MNIGYRVLSVSTGGRGSVMKYPDPPKESLNPFDRTLLSDSRDQGTSTIDHWDEPRETTKNRKQEKPK